MASGTYAPDPFEQYCDDDGNPLSSGSLTTYAAGTSTPVATYSDVNLTVANTNPISLDAAGRPTSGSIFLTPGVSYKFILMDVLGATVATRDNIAAVPLNPNVTGTWVPVIGGSTSQTGQTYGLQFGSYIKLGTVVILFYSVSLTGKGAIVGNLQLKGLPFAANFGTATTIGAWNNTNTNWITLSLLVAFNDSVATIEGVNAAGTSSLTNLTTADITNTFFLNGSLTYSTSS